MHGDSEMIRIGPVSHPSTKPQRFTSSTLENNPSSLAAGAVAT